MRWTYAELKRRVDELALGLMRLGLEPGDRLAIWSPNCAEWVLTQFASAKAGLVLVNINPAYWADELEYSLNKVECKALILAPRFKTDRLHCDTAKSLAGDAGRDDTRMAERLIAVAAERDPARPGPYARHVEFR